MYSISTVSFLDICYYEILKKQTLKNNFLKYQFGFCNTHNNENKITESSIKKKNSNFRNMSFFFYIRLQKKQLYK